MMDLEVDVTRYATLVLLALTLAACSSEPDKNSANAATNNSTMTTGNNTVDNTGAEYAAEYEVIFDSIAFNSDPANKLNTLLNANLDQNLDYPVIILLSLTDVDAEAGTITLEGGSGLKTEEPNVFTYDVADSNATQGTLDAASGEFAADLEFFGFVATFVFEDMVSKTVLPVNDLSLAGVLDLQDGGGARVVNGELAGYLTKADGDDTLITLAPGGMPISLTQVFKENTLNYDVTTGEKVDPGMGDAWFLDGTFTAKPTTIND